MTHFVDVQSIITCCVVFFLGSAIKASVAANKLAKTEERKEKAAKLREDKVQKKAPQGKSDTSQVKQSDDANKSQKSDSKNVFYRSETKTSTSEARTTSPQVSNITTPPEQVDDEYSAEEGATQEEYPAASEEEQKANLEVRTS